MRGLQRRIMEHAEALPEATPLCPAALLHLGNRAAVDQALSRLARLGHLMRICQGVYMRPIETRFGVRAPRVAKAIAALSQMWGETIVPCGLPHLRSQPTAALRLLHRGTASRSALAAGGAAPKGGRRHPRPRMARSRRDRGWPRSGSKDALRCGSGRACGRTGHHADLDGGVGERPPPATGEMFVLFDGTGLVVKRVEPVHGAGAAHELRLKSANPDYNDYTVLAEDVHIVGKVLWTVRRV